ncbi:hypothetical protein Fmac_018745 [Flemingia macrophylla]|uniref:glutathione transferase n=1 Tax=Flemingia macrophylla TaxID=520843 RepID=A0ABD1M5U7_9FABA
MDNPRLEPRDTTTPSVRPPCKVEGQLPGRAEGYHHHSLGLATLPSRGTSSPHASVRLPCLAEGRHRYTLGSATLPSRRTSSLHPRSGYHVDPRDITTIPSVRIRRRPLGSYRLGCLPSMCWSRRRRSLQPSSEESSAEELVVELAVECVCPPDFWPSPSGARVRIALAEKGIKYDSKEEDLSSKSPLLLQMNLVHKKIPVLIHNGKPICDSLIIVQYIEDVWNDRNPLLPSDLYQRAQARFWADYVEKKVYLFKIYELWSKVWTSKGEEQEVSEKEFVEALKLLEDQLGDKTYFGGDNLGFVNIALVPYYSWFKAYKAFVNLNIESQCPKFNV